jgi:hypothetical protein
VASAASRAAKSKRSASSDSASSPSSSLSSGPSGGGSLGSLAAACAPLPAGALRRRAVEERQRWRRPRHLPWRRRPSPASPRAPAQHGSPSIAMRAAAYCLAGNLAGCAHPAPPGRHHHLPGGRQPSAQRFCNARPSGSFCGGVYAAEGMLGSHGGGSSTHILCQQRRTESRTWRRGLRHGMHQERWSCGRKPSSKRRHVRACRGTRGAQEGFRGVNRPEAPWRQNRVLAYARPTL